MNVANTPAIRAEIAANAVDTTAGDCCEIGAAAILASSIRGGAAAEDLPPVADPTAFVRDDADGTHHLAMFVDNLHCAACIRTIEGALGVMPGVAQARVNMSTRRLAVAWRGDDVSARDIAERVNGLGYPVAPYDPAKLRRADAGEERRLLAAMAVAGFAAGNVMLLSVSVWAGLVSDMGPATRDMFHWISALIALPAIAYSGQPFFRSAVAALRAGRMNMDVPISLAVVLAAVTSLHQTVLGREHAYFDAAVGLVFFLLIGRYLDFRARAKARETAEHLIGLTGEAAVVIDPDGKQRAVPPSDVVPGSRVLVAAGGRVPVDGRIAEGISELDTSLVTGETAPRPVRSGEQVFAGMLNLSAPLIIEASASGDATLLAEIVRLIEHAEQGRARFVRIADRAARTYAPAVHLLALATFLGWWLWQGASAETALLNAVAVLIITCPCALGLAVPVVQVIASGVLFRLGVLVKSGDAFERLAEIDTVVFDKTGTLTTGALSLVPPQGISSNTLTAAAALAGMSRHPLSRALAGGVAGPSMAVTEVEETPGRGLKGTIAGRPAKLGSRDWIGSTGITSETGSAGPEIWFRWGDDAPVRFAFIDRPRSDAAEVIGKLKDRGLHVVLISGDRRAVVSETARSLGIEDWHAECLPTGKIAILERLSGDGRKVLMVGDGINDAPALAAGHASISPASATDIAQTAADFVFQGERLAPVLSCIRISRWTDRLVRQNMVLAVGYNLLAVPIAVLGLATPLVAAITMSSSSLLVTLNAMRLRLARAA
jgi:Cu2+-exporting ATPase